MGKMPFDNAEEQIVVSNFLQKNNLFIHKLVSIEKLESFFKKILVYQTNLIRLGGQSDGGYLVPDDLDNVSCCFSPGVASSVQFEKDLAKKNIPSFLIDYSIDDLPEKNDLFNFEKKFLGILNNEKFININDWITKYYPIESKDDFILQMDVEGSEYEILLNFQKSLMKKFRVLVIEFHFFHNIVNPIFYRIMNAVFEKLLETFYIVHIHANNFAKPINILGYDIPQAMEFTFLRKDRLSEQALVSKLPHKLDEKNVEEYDEITLPSYWYKD